MEIIVASNGERYIGLTLEEYNELIIIKGKYEELKDQKENKISWEPYVYPWSTLTKTSDPLPESPYKITLTKTGDSLSESPYKITCSK